MKRPLIVCMTLGLFGTAVPVFWGTTETAIKATSDHHFCGSCHSMEPMVTSFLSDTHGGNNPGGIQATCAQCHLPHTGPFRYLMQKSLTGAWDVWKEHVIGAEDVDWQAKRARRQQYTYNSGCLDCHNALDKSAAASPASWVAHQPMLKDGINVEDDSDNCVACHQHVGHHNLTQALNSARTQP